MGNSGENVIKLDWRAEILDWLKAHPDEAHAVVMDYVSSSPDLMCKISDMFVEWDALQGEDAVSGEPDPERPVSWNWHGVADYLMSQDVPCRDIVVAQGDASIYSWVGEPSSLARNPLMSWRAPATAKPSLTPEMIRDMPAGRRLMNVAGGDEIEIGGPPGGERTFHYPAGMENMFEDSRRKNQNAGLIPLKLCMTCHTYPHQAGCPAATEERRKDAPPATVSGPNNGSDVIYTFTNDSGESRKIPLKLDPGDGSCIPLSSDGRIVTMRALVADLSFTTAVEIAQHNMAAGDLIGTLQRDMLYLQAKGVCGHCQSECRCTAVLSDDVVAHLIVPIPNPPQSECRTVGEARYQEAARDQRYRLRHDASIGAMLHAAATSNLAGHEFGGGYPAGRDPQQSRAVGIARTASPPDPEPYDEGEAMLAFFKGKG